MIVPVAKALYLCDGSIGFPNQRTDLVGIFNSIRPKTYPYVHKQFVVFAQLMGGLGQIPFYFDVRFAQTGELIHTTNAQLLNFPRRDKLLQVAYTMSHCPFSQSGIYLVELYCQWQWVADSTIKLL